MTARLSTFLAILAISTSVSASPEREARPPVPQLVSANLEVPDFETSLQMQCQRKTCCYWGNDGSFWLCSTTK